MHILEAPELIQASDTYELILIHYPEIVPSIGFNVLQQSISLLNIKSRAALGSANLINEPTNGQTGHVTLTREPKTSQTTDYRLSLLNPDLLEGLPRLSVTRMRRLGSAVSTTLYLRDEQGKLSRAPFDTQAEELYKLHSALAQSMLVSPQARNHVETVQARRDSHLAQIADPGVSTADKNRIRDGLQHITLK